jgi:ATP-dependent Clp protease ATP-binding subunit ClpC
MWDRFTLAAKHSVYRSQEMARKLGKDALDTEHMLMGVIADERCHGSQLLLKLGVTRERIERIFGYTASMDLLTAESKLKATASFKDVMDHVQKEANSMAAKYIGTEHLLLGMALNRFGRAGTALFHVGVTSAAVHDLVLTIQAIERPYSEPDLLGEAYPIF